jgi:hypothetical protein
MLDSSNSEAEFPQSSKCDGLDPSHRTLEIWKEVSSWLQSFGLHSDSIRSFYSLSSCLTGPAEDFYYSSIAPDVHEFSRMNRDAQRPSTTCPITLETVADRLRERFGSISPFRDAERAVEQLTQHRDGKYIIIKDLADELEDLGRQL